jgi:hypothetical protein
MTVSTIPTSINIPLNRCLHNWTVRELELGGYDLLLCHHDNNNWIRGLNTAESVNEAIRCYLHTSCSWNTDSDTSPMKDHPIGVNW